MDKHHNGIYKAMAIITILLIILAVSMFNMMVVRGADYYSDSQSKTKRTITTVAERGTIYDTNGIPLAYDKICYNVNFYKDPFRASDKWRAMYTEMILDTIGVIESHGGSTIDTLNIKKDENGKFNFDWKIVLEDDSEMTDAQREQQIMERDKLAKRRHELWCKNMGISIKIVDAEQAYMAIRQRFMIPDDLSYDEARKVLSIWQEVQYLSSTSYKPVTIAMDVDMTTVAELTERSSELEGMVVEESFIRVYPHGETAAHVVGYMSKQYDEALEELLKKDYPSDATAGISGIEATMEEHLSSQIGSRSGERVVEINSRGKIVREIESTPAQPGNDVQLTLDYELQRKTEELLKEGIEFINVKQKEKYDEKNNEPDPENPDEPSNYYLKKEEERGGEDKKTRFAETGAAVVINVKTGQILSLASYPSYDPNLFSGGISEEDYEPLRDEKTTPLFNKAVSSKAEPGSIFKMVTGYAAITDGGVDPNEKFPCLQNYIFKAQQSDPEKYAKAISKNPTCSAVNLGKPHDDEDLISGMRDSCNNYFYAISEEAGIDNIKKWGDAFGLSTKTNIELTSEVTGYVASPDVLYDNTKEIDEQMTFKPLLVQNKLKTEIKQQVQTMFRREVSDEQCQRAAEKIMKCLNPSDPDQEMGGDIRRILREELDIPESMTRGRALDSYLNSVLYELKWTELQTIWTGIGQSTTAVTPVAVARYIAAIANGGTVYDCNIVKRITDSNGKVISESNPKVFNTINDTNDYLSLIQLGMNGVTSEELGGTAQAAFVGFDKITITDANGEEKEVYDVGAKTGTAQVSKIDIENTAWFVGYTPFEEPEIAVVVYIPNGFAGWRAAPIGREIMDYYRDKKDLKTTEEITSAGSLLP